MFDMFADKTKRCHEELAGRLTRPIIDPQVSRVCGLRGLYLMQPHPSTEASQPASCANHTLTIVPFGSDESRILFNIFGGVRWGGN